MLMVRNRKASVKKLRAQILQTIPERYVLFLSWDTLVGEHWDEMLLREHSACGGDDVNILSTKLLHSGAEEGAFCAVTEYKHNRMALVGREYYNRPAHPVPCIAVSCEMLFALTDFAQRAWMTRSELDGAHEDSSLTGTLWTRGANFFSPTYSVFWLMSSPKSQECDNKDTTLIHASSSGQNARTLKEFWSMVGIRVSKSSNSNPVSSRAASGLTLNATGDEMYAKLGQAIVSRKDIVV
tara:strand:- start:149 stop:865 length:717 start_codon:yes stop_codon:yes gene_type:complete